VANLQALFLWSITSDTGPQPLGRADGCGARAWLHARGCRIGQRRHVATADAAEPTESLDKPRDHLRSWRQDDGECDQGTYNLLPVTVLAQLLRQFGPPRTP